jgi:hypothetical protein
VRSVVRLYPGPVFSWLVVRESYLVKESTNEIRATRYERRIGFGDVAQLGERRLCKPEVAGPIPVVSIGVGSYEFVVRSVFAVNNEL